MTDPTPEPKTRTRNGYLHPLPEGWAYAEIVLVGPGGEVRIMDPAEDGGYAVGVKLQDQPVRTRQVGDLAEATKAAVAAVKAIAKAHTERQAFEAAQQNLLDTLGDPQTTPKGDEVPSVTIHSGVIGEPGPVATNADAPA